LQVASRLSFDDFGARAKIESCAHGARARAAVQRRASRGAHRGSEISRVYEIFRGAKKI
jgi:hypothetical protein